jgi:formylglycine-generating enzyme required for sulfatase activity
MLKRIKTIKKIAVLCVLTLLGTIALAAFENELPVKRQPAPKPVAKPTPPPKTAPIPVPVPVPVQTYRPGQVIKDCADCPEMVVIPAGSFTMGSPDNEKDRDANEGPQRTVTLKTFAMGKTEVTQGQWNAIMGKNLSALMECGDDCAVVLVSWNDAQEYIKKLNAMTGKAYSLPSEAQWEYAARAGTTTAFHTGNTITVKQANFNFGTIKVASLNSPNAFGLHDMHGNVWEWTQDVWHNDYIGAPTDGSAWLDGGNQQQRVLRGGSSRDFRQHLRSAYRNMNAPDDLGFSNGFRLARTLP